MTEPPYPRRVRAVLDGVAVVDSSRALLLLEAGHLPVYYFPPANVRTDLLEPTDRPSAWTLPRGGPSLLKTKKVADQHRYA